MVIKVTMNSKDKTLFQRTEEFIKSLPLLPCDQPSEVMNSMSYFPLTPEEMTEGSESPLEQRLREINPCFPQNSEEMGLDTPSPILEDISLCFSSTAPQEMNIRSHDQTVRELNLHSPVTPGDVDLCPPRTSEVNLSFVIPAGRHLPSPLTPSDSSFSFCSSVNSHNDLNLCSPDKLDDDLNLCSPETLDDDLNLCSPETLEDNLNLCSPQTLDDAMSPPAPSCFSPVSLQAPPKTVHVHSPNTPEQLNSPLSHDFTTCAPSPETSSVMKLKSLKHKTEFLALKSTELLCQSKQASVMPSATVDLKCTSTPYTDAARARKPSKNGHIKRPMNAFMIWAQQQRHRIIAQYPGSDNAQISKLLGSTWKNMSEWEKGPYKEEAIRLKQLHEKEFPEYKYKPRKSAKRKAGAGECESEPMSPDRMKKTSKKRATQCTNTSSRKPRRSGKKSNTSQNNSDSECPNASSSSNDCKNLVSLLQAGPPYQLKPVELTTSTLKVLTAVSADEVKDVQKRVPPNLHFEEYADSAEVIKGIVANNAVHQQIPTTTANPVTTIKPEVDNNNNDPSVEVTSDKTHGSGKDAACESSPIADLQILKVSVSGEDTSRPFRQAERPRPREDFASGVLQSKEEPQASIYHPVEDAGTSIHQSAADAQRTAPPRDPSPEESTPGEDASTDDSPVLVELEQMCTNSADDEGAFLNFINYFMLDATGPCVIE